MSLGPERVWVTINACQPDEPDNKTVRLRDTTELWYGIVWSGLLRCGAVRCGQVSYAGCGIVWYGFVWHRIGAPRCSLQGLTVLAVKTMDIEKYQ